MAEPDEIANVLEDAADLLFTEGWCQRRLRLPVADGVTVRCLVAAVADASPSMRRRSGAYDALRRELNFRPGRPEDLVKWNDVEGRTVDEVTDVLRRAGKDLRNGDIVV